MSVRPLLPSRTDFKLLKPLLLCLMLLGTGAAAANWPAPAKPEDSIWPQVIEGMTLGHTERPEVQRYIEHYASKPQALHTMLARAEPFLAFILEETKARGLPTELALLPAVESGWKPDAVSRSAAHGLWQFIPRTGVAYGLHNSHDYNARRDTVASTRAALNLLATLHQQYGDWPLALAAYNAGGVKVQQAMRASRSQDYWQLPLPPVTRDYVPRLLALAALVREPARHGIELPQIAAGGSAEVIAGEHGARLRQAVQAAQVDDAVLRTYNPGGISAIKANTSGRLATLLLPPAEALAVRVELAYLQSDAVLPNTSQSVNDVGTSTVSEPLLAPSLPPAQRPVRKPTVSSLRLSKQMHWDAKLARDKLDTVGGPAMHIVQAGDTLHSIARRYQTSVAALTSLNPSVAGSALRVGQPLLLSD